MLIFTTASIAGASPQLELPVYSLDLGVISHGEKKSITIPLKNSGDEALDIKAIRTSCGCLSAKTDRKHIKPDTESTLNIMFNSVSKRPGVHALKIFIRSNQPDNTLTVIPLTVVVKPNDQNTIPQNKIDIP